jgi:four helix bundle protein
MKDFRKLEVWEKAHKFVLSVYLATEKYPKTELYGLTSQIRRASVSIPTNIAEGCGRGSDADFARFLQISMGSASEVEYELMLSRDLGFLEPSHYLDLEKQILSVKQMLAALLRSLHRHANQDYQTVSSSTERGKRIAESEIEPVDNLEEPECPKLSLQE